ncbi:mediator of RNA polymerase II transcription subunit 14 [Tanacetum coccineum]
MSFSSQITQGGAEGSELSDGDVFDLHLDERKLFRVSLDPGHGMVGLKLLLCLLGSNIVLKKACYPVGVILPIYSKFKANETNNRIVQQKMLLYRTEAVVSIIGKGIGSALLDVHNQQLASTLSSYETCFTQAADSMFFIHEGLQQARAPIYDVPSAIEILLTGTYERLPKCTEDVGIQSTLTDKQQKPVLKKLDTLVRSKLLETALPKEFS